MTPTGDSMNTPTIRKLVALFLSCLVLGACSTTTPRLQPGTWEFTTADGEVTDVSLRELRTDQFYLDAKTHPISGVYALEADELSMLEPDNPRMTGFVWLLRTHRSLVLVKEAPVELSGKRLVSSTLVGPR